MVLQYVEPWLSERDIQPGQRWATEIATKLEESLYGIVCVTRDNLSAPWILFEAGALAKFLQQGRVVPLLLDIDFQDVVGPLAQFQAKKVDKNGVAEVIRSINGASKIPLEYNRLDPQIEALWPDFDRRIGRIPQEEKLERQARPQHEILEELVTDIRALGRVFRENLDGVETKRRMYPTMLAELARELKLGRNDPTPILILASLLRDKFPWIYELGVDAYKTAVEPRSSTSDSARKRFSGALSILQRGPYLKDLADNEIRMLIEEIGHYIEVSPKRPMPRKERGRRKIIK